MKNPRGAFSVRETHGILRRPENLVRAASETLGWTSLYASAQRELPFEASYRAVRDHLVVLHLDGPVGVRILLGKGQQKHTTGPGALFIVPGGMDLGVHLQGALESLHVYLRDTLLREVASVFARGDPALVELVPRLGDRDPLLEHLALSMREALTDPDPGTALYADELARMFGVRLLHSHSNRGLHPFKPPKAGLTRAQLTRAIEFMEACLSKQFSVAELAAAAGLSPAHFIRQFKASLGIAPHQYLLRLRLDRAKRLLRETDCSIAQIAFECGFSHQEHMTRFFSRLVGTTPATFRRAARS